MGQFYLESDEIRELLHNAGKIKKDGKCIRCNGTGWENWNDEGNDVKCGQSNNIERTNGECEKCDGVGYIW